MFRSLYLKPKTSLHLILLSLAFIWTVQPKNINTHNILFGTLLITYRGHFKCNSPEIKHTLCQPHNCWVLSSQFIGFSQDDILIVMPFIILLSVSAVCELADLFTILPFILSSRNKHPSHTLHHRKQS